MKTKLLYLILLPALFAFTADKRPTMEMTPVKDKAVYFMSMPESAYTIVSTLQMDPAKTMNYEDAIKGMIKRGEDEVGAFDALVIRDGRHVHFVTYNDQNATHSGRALTYGDWSFFLLGQPNGNFRTMSTLAFDQEIGAGRTHNQMMTELTSLLREQSVDFDAVILDGKKEVQLVLLQR